MYYHCTVLPVRLVSCFLLPRAPTTTPLIYLELFAMNLKGILIVDSTQFPGNCVQAHPPDSVVKPGTLSISPIYSMISIVWRKSVSWRTNLLFLYFLNFLWLAEPSICLVCPRPHWSHTAERCVLNLSKRTTVTVPYLSLSHPARGSNLFSLHLVPSHFLDHWVVDCSTAASWPGGLALQAGCSLHRHR